MLYTLLYISMVQLAAKDWELLPEELNVWQEIIKIGESIQNEVLQQIKLDLTTFQIKTLQAEKMRKKVSQNSQKMDSINIREKLREIILTF